MSRRLLIVLFVLGIAGAIVQVHPEVDAATLDVGAAIEVIEELEPDDAVLAGAPPAAHLRVSPIAAPRIACPAHAPAAPPPVPPPER